MVIIVRAKEEPDRHFLVDARYLGIGSLCRCIGRVPGVQFTEPPKPSWKYFVWFGEQTARKAHFTFRSHTYTVDNNTPFTGDISVRSEDAPLSDILALQDHVDRTVQSPLRRRIELLLNLKFKESFGHQEEAPPNGEPTRPSDS
jgi:hypothetical protein